MTELDNQKASYDTILPAAVRYDTRISEGAKTLYSDILLLSRKFGYSFATNSHLAELYSVEVRTIQRRLTELSKSGHIRIELENIKGKTLRKVYPTTMTKMSLGKPQASTLGKPMGCDKNVMHPMTKMSHIIRQV